MPDDARDHVRRLLLSGDTRLKQGDRRLAERARAGFVEARAIAAEAGILDERLATIIDLRIAEVDRIIAGG